LCGGRKSYIAHGMFNGALPLSQKKEKTKKNHLEEKEKGKKKDLCISGEELIQLLRNKGKKKRAETASGEERGRRYRFHPAAKRKTTDPLTDKGKGGGEVAAEEKGEKEEEFGSNSVLPKGRGFRSI